MDAVGLVGEESSGREEKGCLAGEYSVAHYPPRQLCVPAGLRAVSMSVRQGWRTVSQGLLEVPARV